MEYLNSNNINLNLLTGGANYNIGNNSVPIDIDDCTEILEKNNKLLTENINLNNLNELQELQNKLLQTKNKLPIIELEDLTDIDISKLSEQEKNINTKLIKLATEIPIPINLTKNKLLEEKTYYDNLFKVINKDMIIYFKTNVDLLDIKIKSIDDDSVIKYVEINKDKTDSDFKNEIIHQFVLDIENKEIKKECASKVNNMKKIYDIYQKYIDKQKNDIFLYNTYREVKKNKDYDNRILFWGNTQINSIDVSSNTADNPPINIDVIYYLIEENNNEDININKLKNLFKYTLKINESNYDNNKKYKFYINVIIYIITLLSDIKNKIYDKKTKPKPKPVSNTQAY